MWIKPINSVFIFCHPISWLHLFYAPMQWMLLPTEGIFVVGRFVMGGFAVMGFCFHVYWGLFRLAGGPHDRGSSVEVGRWFNQAWNDLLAARNDFEGDLPAPEWVCFKCQQVGVIPSLCYNVLSVGLWEGHVGSKNSYGNSLSWRDPRFWRDPAQIDELVNLVISLISELVSQLVNYFIPPGIHTFIHLSFYWIDIFDGLIDLQVECGVNTVQFCMCLWAGNGKRSKGTATVKAWCIPTSPSGHSWHFWTSFIYRQPPSYHSSTATAWHCGYDATHAISWFSAIAENPTRRLHAGYGTECLWACWWRFTADTTVHSSASRQQFWLIDEMQVPYCYSEHRSMYLFIFTVIV